MGGSRDCCLLCQNIDQCCACGQTAHARSQHMGSTGLKKQLATQPGNCCGSGNTLLNGKLIETVSRSLMLVFVG
eukprot:37226-Ditylum_brightwellii.AAC.1